MYMYDVGWQYSHNLYSLILLCCAVHELRVWLVHYSPAVLHGILPEDYYRHHLLLVESVFLLLQDEVGERDIEQSL